MEYIQLHKGDCIDVMKGIPNNSVDLIVTDPPYKVITGGSSRGKKKHRPKGILEENKELMKIIPSFSDWLPECYRILKDGSQAYFMVNFTNLLSLGTAIEKAGFRIHNLLVWEKNNCTPSQWYMKNCEYIFFCRKGKPKYINNIGKSKTVHQFDNIIGNKKHPTEKPLDLMKYYIENSSNEQDVVLDPFMGSGTTGVACVNTNRRFIGIELDDKYFEIARERVREAQINKQQSLFLPNKINC